MSQDEQAGAPGAGGTGEAGGGRAFTATEIGRDWGTSRQYAAQKIKAGCPVDSLEAARAWRSEHARYGVGYRSRGAARVEEKPEKAAVEETPRPPRPVGKHDFSTLEGSLAAAVEVEEEAYSMVREAQTVAELKTSLSTRIQNYNHARAGRLEAAERVQKLREAEELVVPMDRAKEMIRRAVVPLLTRLRSVAKRAAIKANPLDDVFAEGVISEEIEVAIADARAAFGGEAEVRSGEVSSEKSEAAVAGGAG